MKINTSQYYIINNCMFYIISNNSRSTVAKKVWNWNYESELSTEGIEKAIRIPKNIIERLNVLERDFS